MEEPRQETTREAADVRVSPFCIHLRSKRILDRTGLPLTEADVLDGSRWCWCGQTQQILGPDREVAHPEDCRRGRDCFESPFRSML